MKSTIVSIATQPKRINYFKCSFQTLLKQTAIGKVDSIYVNIDSNVAPEELGLYSFLDGMKQKVHLVQRDYRWRSANKLAWTYMEHKDSTILCFDDDKDYPLDCIEELLDAHHKSPDCIVAEESNPVRIDIDGHAFYENSFELSFGQKCFSKYLSNACLFPPRCFGDGSLLTDYSKFYEMTSATHDELWFWLVSTLCKVRSVRLDSTMSYMLDEKTTYKLDDVALSYNNGSQDRVKEYNTKVDQMFGSQLREVFSSTPILFEVDRHNFVSILLGMSYIRHLYDSFKIEFLLHGSLKSSHAMFLVEEIKRHRWRAMPILRMYRA